MPSEELCFSRLLKRPPTSLRLGLRMPSMPWRRKSQKERERERVLRLEFGIQAGRRQVRLVYCNTRGTRREGTPYDLVVTT